MRLKSISPMTSPVFSRDADSALSATPYAVSAIGVSSMAPAEADTTDSSDTNGFSGVHDVFKTVDHWFDRETHQIEREADKQAAQWAQENLPTLNEVGEEILPPEDVLAKLCGELWQRWPERIQVKMQDAIDSAASDLARAVGAARAALVEMKVARGDLRETEGKIEQIRRDMDSKSRPVRYDAFLPARAVWLLTVLLVMVEFIANQPVFRIIWPMQADVAAALSEQLQRAANSGTFSGVKIAALEAISYFEASMLAFAVVVLLFVLSKAIGTSVRALVALKEADHPFASRSIAALHRQKKVLGAVCAVGTIAVLVFLLMSRADASGIVGDRVAEAKQGLARLQQKMDSLDRAGAVIGSAQTMTIARQQDDVARFEEQLQFAKTIEANNVAIAILNVSLVCFAFAVGFMGDKRDLTDTEGEHPDFQRLREKCTRLSEQLVRHANDAREQVTHGQLTMSRLASLHRARPLATLEAKRERLASIIPRWRTENARLRGLDPSSIATFRKPVVLSLPEISRKIVMEQPDSVSAHKKELELLTNAIYSAEREAELPATLPLQAEELA